MTVDCTCDPQWTASAVTFLQLLLWFLLPESPRWLLASGRTAQAEEMCRNLADRAGVTLSKAVYTQETQVNLA